MNPKLRKRLGQIIDFFMYLFLLMQMCYVFIGNIAHEWMGIGFFVCLIFHLILKRKWFVTVLRRKWTKLNARAIADLLIVLLLLCIIVLMASSMDVSRTLFPNIKFWGSSDFHRIMGTVVLALAVAHGGMHGYFHAKKKKRAVVLIVLGVIASLSLGIYLVPYLNRHYRSVEIDYTEAVSGEKLARQDGKAIAIYFTRVGNTDFSEDVDAVSGASLLRADGKLMGNTELMAYMLQDITGCDVEAITLTGECYPSSYSDTCVVAGKEIKQGLFPEIQNIDISSYDTVFLVYPIWWYTLPRPVATFLKENDFSGKKIYLIATQGSNGFASSTKDIMELIPGADVEEGISVYCDDIPKARKLLMDWLKK